MKIRSEQVLINRPLPRGEGVASVRIAPTGSCLVNPIAGFFVRRRMILPLLGAGGRGEGGGNH